MRKRLITWILTAAPVWAQQSLSLREAVTLALGRNPGIAASNAAKKASDSRVPEARSGLLPHVSYSESWTRSDNPVFVFGSLLEQHQFGVNNFQLGPLNQPNFLNDFQSMLTADQTLYNGGRTSNAIRSAELNRDLESEEGRRVRMEVAARTVQAYYSSLMAKEQLSVTAQSMRSVQADLERAESIRDAGMSTDVDVLSIRVHLASVREQQIRREADVEVAGAALNDAIGLPLDTAHELTTALTETAMGTAQVGDLEKTAIADRPEAREANLSVSLAETEARAARSQLRPEVALHGAFEADRQRFVTRGGDNWTVALELRWNLFNGFGDKARIDQSKYAVEKRTAEQQQAASGIRLQVRRAAADLKAASQQIQVAEASVEEAEESVRITRNRYEAGLSRVTDLLQAETALLDARTERLGAIRDQRLAVAMVEFASGTLGPDSPALDEGVGK